jgi:hypothetical protein
MRKKSANLKVILEFKPSEQSSQRLLAAFDLLFNGVEIDLPEGCENLTDFKAHVSCAMEVSESLTN